MVIKAIGIDLAKSVFCLYGIDEHGKCVLRKTVKRHQRPFDTPYNMTEGRWIWFAFGE